MAPGCAFCAQAAGGESHNALFALSGEQWALRPVLAEHGTAVAMPSIGALAPGHVLVCPAGHHRSMVATPGATGADIQELLRRVRARVEDATGIVTHVFEHGSCRGGGRVACSVEHAHIHVVPCESDVLGEISELAAWTPAGEDLADLRSVVGDSEYLLYESPTGLRLATTTNTGLPSQLLRRVFAAELGVEWDWRLDAAAGRVAATADLFGVRALALR